MKSVFAITILFSILGGAAAFEPESYRYRAIISVPKGGGPYRAIPLHRETLWSSGVDPAEIRLVRTAGNQFSEIPFLIEDVLEQTSIRPPVSIPTETLSAQTREDSSFEAILQLAEKEKTAATLRIDTPLDNFEKSLSVWGGNDGATWTVLVDGEIVFDRSPFFDFRRVSVELPKNKFSHFRIRLSKATTEQVAAIKTVTRLQGDVVRETTSVRERPFRVDRFVFLTAKQERREGETERNYKLSIAEKKHAEDTGETTISFEAGKLPLAGFSIQTGANNFRRKVSVQVPNENILGEWRTVAQSYIHRYRIASLDEERLDISFPETTSSKWRLILHDGDNEPLDVSGIEGIGKPYRILALLEEGDSYALYFSNEEDAPMTPDYDTAALRAAKNERIEAGTASLRSVEANPAFVSPTASAPSWLTPKGLLWIAIAIAVAILTWVLVKAAKQIPVEEGEA